MSATETREQSQEHEESGRHPTPSDYVKVAVILFVLTALEVSTYFLDFGPIGVPLLIVLMIMKFLYVAGWFMHLKFDTKVFSRLMYTGLTLALALYAITLVLFVFDHAMFVE